MQAQDGSPVFTDNVLRNNLLTSPECLKEGFARPRPGADGRARDLALYYRI
jgi:hypothetical protein